MISQHTKITLNSFEALQDQFSIQVDFCNSSSPFLSFIYIDCVFQIQWTFLLRTGQTGQILWVLCLRQPLFWPSSAHISLQRTRSSWYTQLFWTMLSIRPGLLSSFWACLVDLSSRGQTALHVLPTPPRFLWVQPWTGDGQGVDVLLVWSCRHILTFRLQCS